MITVQYNVISFQTYNVEQDTFPANVPAHDPDDFIVLPDVDIYDVQRVAVHSGGSGCGCRLLLVRLEEIGYSGRYGTLSLILRVDASRQ